MKPEKSIKIWTEPEQIDLIKCWARDGLTESDIAGKIGINRKTLYLWKAQNPQFAEALRSGKDYIDYQVESALLKAALGTTVTETRIIGKMKGGEMVDVVKEKITREIPPNVLACQTWLFNRRREKWKRNWDTEIETAEEQAINITIKRAGNTIDVIENEN
jgi:transposase-like protein